MGETAVVEEMVSAIQEDVEKFVREWIRGKPKGKRGDLGRMEVQIREWALRMGLEVMKRMIGGIAEGMEREAFQCATCGGELTFCGRREAGVHTSMGEVRSRRGYGECRRCDLRQFPLDEELGLDAQHNTPALQRMVSLAGSVAPFEKASELLGEIGSIPLAAQKVERITEEVGRRVARWIQDRQQSALAGLTKPEGRVPGRLYAEADGTTVPMRGNPEETRSRAERGQRTEGKVEYREVKLGAIFDAPVDEAGNPSVGTLTYTGTFGDAERCVQQVQAEARARGSQEAEEIVLLNDGGEWLWNRLPGAFEGKKVTQILDWCHPSERLTQVGQGVFGEGTPQAREWSRQQRDRLYEGQVLAVIEEVERLKPKTPEAKKTVDHCLGYFRQHAARMNYGELRAQGYFIGSGVIESACKHIVGDRLKRAGMKWAPDHVPQLLALRVCRASGWWGRFWEEPRRKGAA